MERFNPAFLMILLDVVHHAGELSSIENVAERYEQWMRDHGVATRPVSRSEMREAAPWDAPEDRAFLAACAYLAREHGMEHTARAFDGLAEHDGDIDALRAFPNLRDRIKDELDLMLMLWLDSKKASYFEARDAFGKRVSERFPKAVGDVESAGTCYAIEMYPACVFHLMRVMEHALRALTKTLHAPDPIGGDRNWNGILKNVDDAIHARPSWKKGQKPFYTAAHGLLIGVKDAWRNECMHVDATYEEGDARRIYHAVAGFMQLLGKMPRRLA